MRNGKRINSNPRCNAIYVCYYICVIILLCVLMLPYVSACNSYYYICVLILPCVLILLRMCPHTTKYVSSYYYMCPHTTKYVSSYYYLCPHTKICVLILLYKCLILLFVRLLLYILKLLYVSSYYCICPHYYICPHTTINMSSYYYICPYTTVYVSSYYNIYAFSYYYICVRMRLHSGKHNFFLFSFHCFWVVNLVQSLRFREAITFFFGITCFFCARIKIVHHMIHGRQFCASKSFFIFSILFFKWTGLRLPVDHMIHGGHIACDMPCHISKLLIRHARSRQHAKRKRAERQFVKRQQSRKRWSGMPDQICLPWIRQFFASLIYMYIASSYYCSAAVAAAWLFFPRFSSFFFGCCFVTYFFLSALLQGAKWLWKL